MDGRGMSGARPPSVPQLAPPSTFPAPPRLNGPTPPAHHNGFAPSAPAAFPPPPSTSYQRTPQPPIYQPPRPPTAFPPTAQPQAYQPPTSLQQPPPSSSSGYYQPPPASSSSYQPPPPPTAGYQPPGPPGHMGPPRPPMPPQPPTSSFPSQTNNNYPPPSSSFAPGPPGFPPRPSNPITNGPPSSNSFPPSMNRPPQPGPPPTSQMNGYPGKPNGSGHDRPPDPSHEQFARLSIAQQGLHRPVDLLATKDIHPGPTEPSPPALPAAAVENPNAICDPAIFRSTLGAIPGSQELLKRARLPLGLVLHPFKDMKSLTILQVSQIVRCRACRTYINPFATLSDNRHWRCNICFRNNDLPEDFSWDPVTKSYGEPQRRPEIRHATIEFIAPSEYMPIRKNMAGRNELRPPQAACYVFVLDVSRNAIETGYLSAFVAQFLNSLDRIPGDNRTMMGFVTVNSCVHFYQFVEDDSDNLVPPRQLVIPDLDEMFLPSTDGLLVNLSKCKESIREFVSGLVEVFEDSNDPHSALGPAVKAAEELIRDIGGRITVVQSVLPDKGPGSLTAREDPNQRASSDVSNLGPANDFYKQLALECSGHQVAIDLFLLSSQYADIATLSGMAKFCGGVIHYYPSLHFLRNSVELRRFEKDLARYLTRKIGFESVLRIRCTKGLALHTFHGNFFVRSTDLLALPNTNPDTALGVSVQMEENISDLSVVSFQSALLYTSSRGDRRIRVHTLCLPVTNSLPEIQSRADPEALVSLLAKMAVERSIASGSIADAREALVHPSSAPSQVDGTGTLKVNAVVDALGSYMAQLPASQKPPLNALPAPPGLLRLLPLYVLALLKHHAFSHGTSVKLDLRVFSMCQFRTLPLRSLLLEIYPALYPLHHILDYPEEEGPPQLQLSYARVDQGGVYLLDTNSRMYLYVTSSVSQSLMSELWGVGTYDEINENMATLPELDNPLSLRVREFLSGLQSQRPFHAPLFIIREDGRYKEAFCRRLVEDKTESAHSYVEFLQHIRREMGSK